MVFFFKDMAATEAKLDKLKAAYAKANAKQWCLHRLRRKILLELGASHVLAALDPVAL